MGPLGLEKPVSVCLERFERLSNVPFLAFLDPRGFGAARVRVEGLSVFGILIISARRGRVSWYSLESERCGLRNLSQRAIEGR